MYSVELSIIHAKYTEYASVVNDLYHGSYYSAEFIFPDFPRQNELFSPTILFTQNTNVGFQALAITLETTMDRGGPNLEVQVQIICKRSKQAKFWTVLCSVRFFCIFGNFCTLVLLNSLTIWLSEFSLTLECKIPWLSLTFWFFPDFPWLLKFRKIANSIKISQNYRKS